MNFATVRSSSEADLQDLQVLHQHLCENEAKYVLGVQTDFSYSDEGVAYFKARMESPNEYVKLVLVNAHPVGFLIASLDQVDCTWAKLDSFYINSNDRGRGLGRLLFEDFVCWTKLQGCERVTVAVADSNIDAWAIYLKLGFKELDRKGHSVILELTKTAS